MKNQKRHLDNHLMLERLCKIHAKIKSGCYPNCQQLAYDNEVSIATINRDIDFLRDRFGASDILEYDAVHRGYHYKKDFEMIWRVSCQYQRTKKGQFQSLTGFDHYDIRGFNKLSYPRSMVRRKLLHYANGNQFYRKIQLS